MIDNYLPAIFKEPWELQRSSNKKQGYDIFQSFKIINLDDEKIEIEIMNDLDKLSYPQFKLYTIELIKDFNDIEEEINSWLLIYKDVTSQELSKLIHKLLYELRSFKYKYGQYLDLDNSYSVSNFADYVTSIIFDLIPIYQFVLSEYPIEEKQ
ncbi:MAG TPA: hypothetical protein VFC41_09305 [Anaerovoracaceae bacterium]|nr:hypothetical protein [Anaerovoracaceae bacterium]